MIITYIIILALLIYSGLMTYLYWREKRKQGRQSEFVDRDVDMKIQEIGNRLEEIRRESKSSQVDLDDEDW